MVSGLATAAFSLRHAPLLILRQPGNQTYAETKAPCAFAEAGLNFPNASEDVQNSHLPMNKVSRSFCGMSRKNCICAALIALFPTHLLYASTLLLLLVPSIQFCLLFWSFRFWHFLNPSERLPCFLYPRFEPVERDKEVADSKLLPPLLIKYFRWPVWVARVGFLTLNPRTRQTYTLGPRQCWEAPDLSS